MIHIFYFVKCLGLALFHFIFSYVSVSIQFCFIILTLFISNISHIFLFDFNRYSISIFSTSTQLLSSQVYLFIYDFKRDKYHTKRWTVNLLIFTKYKCAIWQNGPSCHEIISYYHVLLLLNCNLVFIFKLAWIFNFQPSFDVLSVYLQFQNNKWNRFANK